MREHLLRLIYLYVPSSVLHIFLLFQLFPSLCEGFLGLLVEGFSVCYCLLKLRLLLFGHGHKQQTIISFILIIYAFYLFLLLYSVVNLSLDALEHWQNHIIIINCDFEIRVIAGIHGGCFGFLFIQELLDIFVYGIQVFVIRVRLCLPFLLNAQQFLRIFHSKFDWTLVLNEVDESVDSDSFVAVQKHFILTHKLCIKQYVHYNKQNIHINRLIIRVIFMQDDQHQMFKIVVIGNSGTGKTNISTRYVRNQFSESIKATVGVEFLYKIIDIHSQKIKVTLWDTAGQQKFKGLSKVYYKGASGVLIVYDVTDPQSYLDIESWMRLANQNLNLNEVVLMVIGNKVDMQQQRKVPTQRPIRQYKEKFDIDCWEVSAKTGYNIKEVLGEMIQKIYQLNVQPRGGSVMPYTSYAGDSMLDPPESIIGNGNKGNNPYPRISKNIPEPVKVIEQQNEIPVQRNPKKKEKNIVLSVHENKKIDKKKKEGCDC